MLVKQNPTPEHAAPPPRRTSRFERLAGWSTRHRWWALLSWLAVLVAVSVGAQVVGADYRNDVSLPGTESQRALDTLREGSPEAVGTTVQIVVADPDGLGTPENRGRVGGMLDQVRGLPSVADVRDPFTDPGALNADGTVGYATVTLDRETADVPPDDVRRLVDTARQVDGDGLRVEVGGDAVVATEEGGGGPAEGLGLLAALVILVLLFGSVLAASLPIVIAVFAVGTAMGLVVLASHVATVADYTSPLMVLVGLGVGIDYALLLFSRYRGELLSGATSGEATRRAVDTAGRTVLFAGTTVILALLGLVVLGLGSLQGVAVAVALTVATTMVAALVLLPALLAVMSRRIERAVHRRAGRGPGDGTRWATWSTLVQRHPWTASLLALGALLALAAPVLDMRLGIADPGNGATSRTSRQAYDLLARGFGPGFNGPLVVVVDATGAAGADPRAAAERAHPVLVGTP
ncbi:MMPL family transporter, partial [Micromonospora sp. NPDC049799]|uniref:MMPL family transporter n=1 Tax=Micromonospora sp. NPDC049799 TaxID=3154741 RepID=UPI00340134F8